MSPSKYDDEWIFSVTQKQLIAVLEEQGLLTDGSRAPVLASPPDDEGECPGGGRKRRARDG